MKFPGVYEYTVILTYMTGICDAFDGTIARSRRDCTG